MIALIGYQLAVLGNSQRYLPPVLLYVGLLAAFYSNNSGPALAGFALTAGALLVVAGWLTVALVDAEDPVQRMVTTSHTGALHRVVAAIVLAVLFCCAGLTALSVAWAAISHTGPGYSGADIVVGVHAHLVCAATGIAVGLPSSRLLIRRIGYTVIVAGTGFGIILLARWVPPVHGLLEAMTNGVVKPRVLLRSSVLTTAAITASPLLVARWSGRRG